MAPMRRFPRVQLAMIAVLLLSSGGCQFYRLRAHPLIETPFAARPADAPVEIFASQEDVERPFIAVARVSAGGDFEVGRKRVTEKVRALARKHGAHALILEVDLRGGLMEQPSRLGYLAIRYTDEPIVR